MSEINEKRLTEALGLLLDHVDYTGGACGPTELIAGTLPIGILEIAKTVYREAISMQMPTPIPIDKDQQ